jgi:hypothetical protein
VSRSPQPLPRFPRGGHAGSLEGWANALVAALEKRLSALELPAKTGYQISNLTPQRTLDAAAGTLADVRAVLGTLITDNKTSGDLG